MTTATTTEPELDTSLDFEPELNCEAMKCLRNGPHKAEWYAVMACGHRVLGCSKAAAVWVEFNTIHEAKFGKPFPWMDGRCHGVTMLDILPL